MNEEQILNKIKEEWALKTPSMLNLVYSFTLHHDWPELKALFSEVLTKEEQWVSSRIIAGGLIERDLKIKNDEQSKEDSTIEKRLALWKEIRAMGVNSETPVITVERDYETKNDSIIKSSSNLGKKLYKNRCWGWLLKGFSHEERVKILNQIKTEKIESVMNKQVYKLSEEKIQEEMILEILEDRMYQYENYNKELNAIDILLDWGISFDQKVKGVPLFFKVKEIESLEKIKEAQPQLNWKAITETGQDWLTYELENALSVNKNKKNKIKWMQKITKEAPSPAVEESEELKLERLKVMIEKKINIKEIQAQIETIKIPLQEIQLNKFSPDKEKEWKSKNYQKVTWKASVLEWALKHHHWSLVNVCLKKGCSLLKKDELGSPVFFWAMYKEKEGFKKELKSTEKNMNSLAENLNWDEDALELLLDFISRVDVKQEAYMGHFRHKEVNGLWIKDGIKRASINEEYPLWERWNDVLEKQGIKADASTFWRFSLENAFLKRKEEMSPKNIKKAMEFFLKNGFNMRDFLDCNWVESTQYKSGQIIEIGIELLENQVDSLIKQYTELKNKKETTEGITVEDKIQIQRKEEKLIREWSDMVYILNRYNNTLSHEKATTWNESSFLKKHNEWVKKIMKAKVWKESLDSKMSSEVQKVYTRELAESSLEGGQWILDLFETKDSNLRTQGWSLFKKLEDSDVDWVWPVHHPVLDKGNPLWDESDKNRYPGESEEMLKKWNCIESSILKKTVIENNRPARLRL